MILVEKTRQRIESIRLRLKAHGYFGLLTSWGGLGLDPHFLLFEWLFVKGNLRSGQLKLVRRFTDAARQTFRDSQVDTIPPSSCSGHGPKFIKIHQIPLGGGSVPTVTAFFYRLTIKAQMWQMCMAFEVCLCRLIFPCRFTSSHSFESRDMRRSGQPLVRQLLMGEGKSAVIAPLLSLLLAEELVLQAPSTKTKCVEGTKMF